MEERLDEDIFELITEVSDDVPPYVGEFGRLTYFFMMIGGKVIPLY
jgi:hypothetical protein